MSDDRLLGRPHTSFYPTKEELDNLPPAGPSTPTVEPLRIHKTGSPASSAHTAPPARTHTPASGSGRFKFGADDPNRPTIHGYVTSRSPPPASKHAPYPTLPESPGPDTPEKDVSGPAYPTSGPGSSGNAMPTPDSFMPRPIDTTESHLGVPEQSRAHQNLTRAGTQTSVMTTRAERGSPPPPETPLAPVPALPAQFAHLGSNAQGNAAAAAARITPATQTPIQVEQLQPQTPPQAPQLHVEQPQQVSQPQPPTVQMSQVQTQQPQAHPFAQPAFYRNTTFPQATGEPTSSQTSPQQQVRTRIPQQQPTSQDGASPPTAQPGFLQGQTMQGLTLQDEPPPAYTDMPANSPYGIDKRQGAANLVNAMDKTDVQGPDLSGHPAYVNASPSQRIPSHPAAVGLAPVQIGHVQQPRVATPATLPASPPPLPEGWISHLDQNSGQYYYIHMPTRCTQWEFPKGPTPLAIQEPSTPIAHTPTVHSPVYAKFAGKSLGSPGYPSPGVYSQFGGYGDTGSVIGPASPTATIFTGPPPSAGIEVFRVAPTNGVYFGPYLRYTNIDLERSLWLGSILLITDAHQPPTIHIHQSIDLSPNPRQLKAQPIYSHQRYIFYRYDIDLLMEEHPTKWLYAITSHLGCTRYEFLVAGRYETNWRFVTHSGNDFAISVNSNERTKLGGVGLMWKDLLQKHQECGGFHAQIGLGGQISADRLWHDVPMLKQWTGQSGKDNRKNAPWSPRLDDDVKHAFFHYYTSHFDQPHLREAIAQIPHVFALDDHDIFDGFGSYPDYMQQSNMFKNVGRIGIDMYLLFQHHTTYEIMRNMRGDLDLFTITGHGWHFIKFLGPGVVIVGPDTRSERTLNQVMAGPTYQGIFPKIANLPPSVQHCIWIFPVPIIYPRLHSANQIANTVASGKKAVTGTFNMLGKVTSSVAGIVGAKDVVNDGFLSVKKAVGKSGLMSGMLSPFGEFDMTEELRDLWTHDSKDLERTYIIRTLQGISHNKSIRMTFLSGSVNCAGAGLVHDPNHPANHKTMYQLISSAIVNAPPSSMVLRMLNTDPKNPIYVPPNGQRSRYSSTQPMPVTDTKEDMMEIFVADPDGHSRDMKRLMGRRNYVAMVVYDPDLIQQNGGYAQQPGHHHRSGSMARPTSPSPSAYSGTTAFTISEPRMGSRLSLAADFIVQSGEGGYGGSVKYGPVVIPSLEYGR